MIPPLHVAVISANRPGNVPNVHTHTEGLPEPVWYVPTGQAPDYRYCGALNVIEVDGLCAARNRALDDADGKPTLQLSDDLRRIGWANGRTVREVTTLQLRDAVTYLLDALTDSGAQLAGAAPTANPFFSRPGINTTGFIVGDMVLTAAGCPLRYDTELRLKEDYDYTLQHLACFGTVARVDQLLATFLHRTNRGGAVDVRTPDLEDDTISYLMGKWPGQLRLNPRRPHEVLLRWRPRQQ